MPFLATSIYLSLRSMADCFLLLGYNHLCNHWVPVLPISISTFATDGCCSGHYISNSATNGCLSWLPVYLTFRAKDACLGNQYIYLCNYQVPVLATNIFIFESNGCLPWPPVHLLLRPVGACFGYRYIYLSGQWMPVLGTSISTTATNGCLSWPPVYLALQSIGNCLSWRLIYLTL